MAVDKAIAFKDGGTLVVALERINLFTASESERTLLAEIGDAIRKFERRVQAETPSEPPSKATDG